MNSTFRTCLNSLTFTNGQYNPTRFKLFKFGFFFFTLHYIVADKDLFEFYSPWMQLIIFFFYFTLLFFKVTLKV